jgi:hypothetical protein
MEAVKNSLVTPEQSFWKTNQIVTTK